MLSLGAILSVLLYDDLHVSTVVLDGGDSYHDAKTATRAQTKKRIKMIELEKLLAAQKENLKGDWVNINSSYDGYICKILGMQEDTRRYWDAIWQNKHIEFKKGNSIWIDLIRYSETLTEQNNEASIETQTLFFIPNKNRDRIDEVICVETKKIIKHLNLDRKIAESLIYLNKTVPRSINAQASLTKNDVKKIASFIV